MRQYKDSKIKWIGLIPEKWQVCKIKNLCTDIYSGGTPDSNNMLFWDGDIPWIPSGSCHDSLITEAPKSITRLGYDNSSTKMIPADTTVMAMTGATCGNVGFVTFETSMNQSVTGYIAKKDTFSKFLFYCLLAAREDILTHKTGGAQSGINVEDCKSIVVPLIPRSEQQRIADYLDEKCEEIDSLIVLQEQMIEKLKAYRQSVITEAVTKGLDPNAKLVPSGIDWIGEIPEGWLVTDIKKLCISITDGSHFSPERQSEGMPYITAGDIRGKGIDYNNAMRIRIEDYNLLESQGCRPHKGDILMVKDGATTGRVGMMIDNEECVLLSSVAMLTPLPNVDSNYLMYLIQSNVIQAQIQLLMAGSAMPRVTLKKINSLKGLLIPLNDQHSIASYLDSKCADIDRLIALKQQKVEKLKDYKKSVIYEAVTGKTIIE